LVSMRVQGPKPHRKNPTPAVRKDQESVRLLRRHAQWPSGPEPLSCHRTSQFTTIMDQGKRSHRACLILGFARGRPVCTWCKSLVWRVLRPSSASVFFTHDNLW